MTFTDDEIRDVHEHLNLLSVRLLQLEVRIGEDDRGARLSLLEAQRHFDSVARIIDPQLVIDEGSGGTALRN